jgi:hypothetical protein
MMSMFSFWLNGGNYWATQNDVVKLGLQAEHNHTHPQITNEILLVHAPAIVDIPSVRYFEFVQQI